MNENLIRGIIYLRTSPSGKYYVGQTCNEERRQKDWMNLNRDYSGGLINNARNKYGPENFQYEILFEVELADKDEVIKIIDEKEIYFIERDENTRSDLESLFQLWLRRVGIQEMELGDREEA